MMHNPVFNREMKVSARSIRLPVVIFLFNGILSLVTLLNMYSAVEQVKMTAAIQYSSFMNMYEFVTAIEFILLMFIVPAVTASGISGERERQTLDLMLTTQMTAFQVVTGKLMSALATLLILIVSSFPAIAMVFVYGGITWGDACSLFMCYFTVAFFAGSLGLCFSALFKRSTASTVVTYGVLAAVVAGTYYINKFSLSLSAMSLKNSVASYGALDPAVKATSGGFFYLLLLNPAATFMAILDRQMGGSGSLTKMKSYFGMTNNNFIMDNWIIISILIQLALAVLMIYMAVRCVEPVKLRHRNRKQKQSGGSFRI